MRNVGLAGACSILIAVAQLSFACESWTAPLQVRRVRPQEHANAVVAEQISPLHLPPEGPLAWFLCEAGYDPVRLTQMLSEARAAILIGLRSRRRFSADPPAQSRSGRPGRLSPTVRAISATGVAFWANSCTRCTVRLLSIVD